MSMPVMLFAAGFGTRMKHLTADRPKPMVEVAGRPLIDHAISLADGISPPSIVANLHYLPDILQQHLHPKGIQTIVETPDILETGGGLRNALPVLGAGPVFTMNTDAIWNGPNPLNMLLNAWDPDRMDALLMGIPPENALEHSGAGDFTIDDDGRLSRGPGVVYGGVQIIKTDLLSAVSERSFSLNLIWDQMLANGKLHGIEYSGRWCDVGHPDGVKTAEALLANNV
ncbi:nucleotidyltransferase family protein [Sulfitobacter donghicola]|uniref:Nucleotidyltransferase n=1 Tax=Sulfitobacter donghicola DSW-25 = KCTC 12864 = JCM 14565 TaxID=1300350 RepID=A0A073ILM2_9RHOB|nr:nucleotidyltransferase family protein [Sulfitobacter donghicola]KEJ90629.1 nucleotidyltransferase [Sulfitobacter donghicola DSW-25 = KCTC 12864 = JCM 14565]KIN67878.1 Nucleotidyl transferase [Sulfitobacter donghicola DSW-25 = KCTC 12864 = JCM 14565]